MKRTSVAQRFLAFGCVVAFMNVVTLNAFGQKCGLIENTRLVKAGDVRGASINSKDYFSLLIERRMDGEWRTDSMAYSFFLNAASRVLLSDSLVRSKGRVELLLTDGQTITLEDADCVNSPLGPALPSIGFNVRISERQMRILADQPILTFKAFGILSTTFSERMMKRQRQIVQCLLAEQ